MRRLRSIRLQLLLPILIATIGLAVLGTQQTRTALAADSSAQNARVVAGAATATVGLIHELEREVAEVGALRLRGGKAGEQLVIAQRGRTDTVKRRYDDAQKASLKAVPALAATLDGADRELTQLATVRQQSLGAPDQQKVADVAYRNILTQLIAVADALPAQLDDAVLASRTRAIAALAAAGDLAAQERDLLRAVFSKGAFAPGEQTALAALGGAAGARTGEFGRVADEQARNGYDQMVTGPDVDTARAMMADALRGDREPDKLKIDPDAWYTAQTHLLRRTHDVEIDLAAGLDAEALGRQDAARSSSVRTVVLTGAIMLLSVLAAVLLAARTAQRLHRLRRGALAVAAETLPAAIAEVERARDPAAVRDLQLSLAATADKTLAAGTKDEISQVARAFSTLHRQAIRLAADQALLRLDVAATLVALSRRSQTLISRQIQLLDDLERTEADPDILEQFFALDHLAARMRRNEENLLLLAGGAPGRRFTTTELLEDVVKAAAAEIEDFTRVEQSGLSGVAVVGPAVGDLVHLLAELLENAVTFSPPDSQVTVTARRNVDDLTITVYDQGIGIPREVLDEVNERLDGPAALTASLAGTMGLLVVARLAARQHITVQLNSRPGAGTAALIRLPAALLAAPKELRDRGTKLGGEQIPEPRAPGDTLEPAPFVDPDEIRSRLSSFASGIAAANNAQQFTPDNTASRP